jgi:hypothetical protein
MNAFKSYIRGFRGGGRACPCCVDHHSKQITRRWARHRLKQADRENLLANDEEENCMTENSERSSHVVENSEDEYWPDECF